MSVAADSKKLERFAEEIGCETHSRHAQTGTIYLTVHNPHGNSTVIRIADHADAYGRADYTCDGFEGTLAGARQHILTIRETTMRAVNRLRRARRSKSRREVIFYRERWVAGIVAQGEMSLEEAVRQANNIFGR